MKNIISLHRGSVVQWIEFKIPVLTMKVRILSESPERIHLYSSFFSLYPTTKSIYTIDFANIPQKSVVKK